MCLFISKTFPPHYLKTLKYSFKHKYHIFDHVGSCPVLKPLKLDK